MTLIRLVAVLGQDSPRGNGSVKTRWWVCVSCASCERCLHGTAQCPVRGMMPSGRIESCECREGSSLRWLRRGSGPYAPDGAGGAA